MSRRGGRGAVPMVTLRARELGQETLEYYTVAELFAAICRRSDGALLTINPLAKKEPAAAKFQVLAFSGRDELPSEAHAWILARRACQHLRPAAQHQVDLAVIEDEMRQFGIP